MPVTRDDFLKALRSAAEPEPAKVLDALVDVSGAERGFLVLRRGGELDVRGARAMDPEDTKISRTLVDRAMASGRPLLATDADVDLLASLRERNVRSVCVLPLRACGGAVYLDHRRTKDLFQDADFLEAVAGALDQALVGALERRGDGELVGTSAPMRELRRLIDKVAVAPYPVLILGESGTGKELAARAVHAKSPRAAGPFVAANCAAIPENLLEAELFGHAKGAFTGADRDRAGLFEQARGGTLFLDEVACLSPRAQESLLRVLESGEIRRVGGSKAEAVDVRVVAATNENLEEDFRRDLYYRLNVLRLELPPLRERAEDLPLLADKLLRRAAAETGLRRRLAPDALAALAAHRWPGNVRELENALRRAVSLAESELLRAADFAFLSKAGEDPDILSVDAYMKDVLLRWQGRLSLEEIATRLGLSRKTLWDRKKKWGL
ncbi:MAG TPA: sigma-54-dependent Fis family transcriptional regulator [Planctomycetota bacterium]